MPAVIYAVANQRTCCAYLNRVPKGKQEEWYAAGVAWMRQNPAFLEKFGWKERKSAVLAAGLLAMAIRREEGRLELEELLRTGWSLMWERMGQIRQLDAAGWEEMMAPWQDSCYMSSGVAAVLLLMAALNDKPVRDRDRLWRSLQKLRQFSRECFQGGSPCPPCREEFPFEKEDRMGWLLSRFANPQKPAYIREKARISSEWLERLYRVMFSGGPAGIRLRNHESDLPGGAADSGADGRKTHRAAVYDVSDALCGVEGTGPGRQGSGCAGDARGPGAAGLNFPSIVLLTGAMLSIITETEDIRAYGPGNKRKRDEGWRKRILENKRRGNTKNCAAKWRRLWRSGILRSAA